jgi:hypothetical protein
MRLIDADASKKQIAGMTIANNYPANKASALCDLMDAQPTAYDVDKVVEQLDTYITKLVGRSSALYQTVMQIVRGGGVDG